MISVKQTYGHVYSFDREWMEPGGPLYGSNFLTDICENRETFARRSADIWIIPSLQTDPDYLLYLWKKGRGEDFEFYIAKNEVLFLYHFYHTKGFHMMLDDVMKASARINKKNCEII